MEVKMRPVRMDEIPGMHSRRPHDDWAVDAVQAFLDCGEQAVELEVPAFNVSYHTVLCILRQRGTARGVKVKSVKADTPPTHFRTFLYRKEERC